MGYTIKYYGGTMGMPHYYIAKECWWSFGVPVAVDNGAYRTLEEAEAAYMKLIRPTPTPGV